MLQPQKLVVDFFLRFHTFFLFTMASQHPITTMSAPQFPSDECTKELADLKSESERKVGRIGTLTTRLEKLKAQLEEGGVLESSITEAQADIDHLHNDIARIQDYIALISLHLFLSFFSSLSSNHPLSRTQPEFPNRKKPLSRSQVSLFQPCCHQALRGGLLMLLPRLHALHPPRAFHPHPPRKQLRRHRK